MNECRKGECIDELRTCCGYGHNGALGSLQMTTCPRQTRKPPPRPDQSSRICELVAVAVAGGERLLCTRENIGAMPLVKDVKVAIPNGATKVQVSSRSPDRLPLFSLLLSWS